MFCSLGVCRCLGVLLSVILLTLSAFWSCLVWFGLVCVRVIQAIDADTARLEGECDAYKQSMNVWKERDRTIQKSLSSSLFPPVSSESGKGGGGTNAWNDAVKR